MPKRKFMNLYFKSKFYNIFFDFGHKEECCRYFFFTFVLLF